MALFSKADSKPLARLAWLIVLYTVLVILWGAFVRATGSGAGCGSHWPTCNGEVIHRPAQLETVIELTHRLTSAFLGVLCIALLAWAMFVYPRGHRVRRAAGWSLFLVIVEGALGAGLVVFEWVAGDTSTARVLVVGLHLVNTMLLTAALTITAWWASGGAPLTLRRNDYHAWLLGGGLVSLLILSAFGAVTALGDTLFPVDSLAEGVAQDFDPEAHIAVRLRIWHPVLAVLTSVYLITLIYSAEAMRQTPLRRRLAAGVVGILIAQVSLGTLNILLLAPVWLQMVHLLLSNALWIVLLLLTMVVLEARPRGAATAVPILHAVNGHLSTQPDRTGQRIDPSR